MAKKVVMMLEAGYMGSATIAMLGDRDIQLRIVDPGPSKLGPHVAKGVNASVELGNLTPDETVVLSMPPQAFPAFVALLPFGEAGHPGGIISVMAGVRIATIQAQLRSVLAVRAIPNTPSEVCCAAGGRRSACTSAVHGGNDSEWHHRARHALLRACRIGLHRERCSVGRLKWESHPTHSIRARCSHVRPSSTRAGSSRCKAHWPRKTFVSLKSITVLGANEKQFDRFEPKSESNACIAVLLRCQWWGLSSASMEVRQIPGNAPGKKLWPVLR